MDEIIVTGYSYDHNPVDKIVVIGYSYRYNPVGIIRIPFKRGSYYKQLKVSSQYGWGDVETETKKILKDVVCVEHRPGDAHSIGTATFMPAKFKCVAKNGNPISAYFESGDGFWHVFESIEDCSVPQEHMVSDILSYI